MGFWPLGGGGGKKKMQPVVMPKPTPAPLQPPRKVEPVLQIETAAEKLRKKKRRGTLATSQFLVEEPELKIQSLGA